LRKEGSIQVQNKVLKRKCRLLTQWTKEFKTIKRGRRCRRKPGSTGRLILFREDQNQRKLLFQCRNCSHHLVKNITNNKPQSIKSQLHNLEMLKCLLYNLYLDLQNRWRRSMSSSWKSRRVPKLASLLDWRNKPCYTKPRKRKNLAHPKISRMRQPTA